MSRVILKDNPFSQEISAFNNELSDKWKLGDLVSDLEREWTEIWDQVLPLDECPDEWADSLGDLVSLGTGLMTSMFKYSQAARILEILFNSKHISRMDPVLRRILITYRAHSALNLGDIDLAFNLYTSALHKTTKSRDKYIYIMINNQLNNYLESRSGEAEAIEWINDLCQRSLPTSKRNKVNQS